MSFQSQLKFPVRKRSVKEKGTENSEPLKKPVGAKRALFGEAQTSSKKARISDENSNGLSQDKASINISSCLTKAKKAFHTGLPSKLVGRSKEISEVQCFLNNHINNKSSGSLYISGAPGTGKTSILRYVLKSIETKYSFAFVNCMSINTPTRIYTTIAKAIGLSSKVVNSKSIAESLKKHVTMSECPTVLVLDEIDQLDCKGQEILYNLFQWPHLPGSSLILIGIANALDLTDRILPRLHTFKCQPKLMHFLPYTKDEIVSILEGRLSEFQPAGTPVIKPIAIQLCARKIAANTGDIRKALDVCRRALEIVENNISKQLPLRSTSDDRCNPGSPTKRSTASQCVDLQEISAVLHEVYGSQLQTMNLSSNSESVTMPLQHMILLCTLVLMKKFCKVQDMNMGKAYDTYKRICTKRDITVVSESAFHGLCKLVESRGFIQLKPCKVARMMKIVLKFDENEAEHVLQDKAMLPSILADHSVLGK